MRARNTPLYFRKAVQSEDTKPNAKYLRSMGTVKEHGIDVPVCEVEYQGEPWICRESEAVDIVTALRNTAKKWRAEIDLAEGHLSNKATQNAISIELGIGLSTLYKRRNFIKKYLK